MMSLHSFETRYLITKGFRKENIHNPFIEGMIEKNSFPLTKSDYISADEEMACTSMGAAFFIVPFVNAMTRSGTAAEKELLFESMLESAAYMKILSNKRGHKQGEMQPLLAQALRTVTNVKNRQTRAEDAGMSLLESKIKENNLLNHKILLFLLNPNEIEPNIRGLVANKMMAKYQRPCLVLSKTQNHTYEGSGRGYTKTGIDSFKNILEKCDIPILYVQGHDNAFGFGIEEELIPSFIEQTDMLLKDVSTEPLYRIDYDLKETDQCQQIILDIAELNDLWGQDVERSFVNMNFKITTTNFELMKSNTLKFTLPNGVSLIKFNGSEDEIETFSLSSGYIEVNAICKCNANKWNGNVYPQLMIEDYEIVNVAKYIF